MNRLFNDISEEITEETIAELTGGREDGEDDE